MAPTADRYDFIVVGAGVAGLRAAVSLAEAGTVLLLAKQEITESATQYAQGGIAVALSDDEVSSILFRVASSKDKPKMKIRFEKNEAVRITEGPFANFNGIVDEINEDRETLKVMVTIFGRSTPVELEFSKVDKIE